LADLKPIAHLYKTQVYALAEYLGVADEIRCQLPTTDTYSMPQSQEEFYFALSYREADHVLCAMNQGLTPESIARQLNRTPREIERAMADFGRKRIIGARTLRQAYTIEDGS